MIIHEYQAKRLLASHGARIPEGHVAFSGEESGVVANKLGGDCWVVKAQIHSGGRSTGHFAGAPGRLGGVRFVQGRQALMDSADEMLGNTLITQQTGPAGQRVRRVYLEKQVDIVQEMYLGMLVDPVSAQVTLLASAQGGMKIEERAAQNASSVISVAVDMNLGITAPIIARVTTELGLKGKEAELTPFLVSMHQVFTGLDATLIEINPLALTTSSELVALDVAMSFDDNALYKHPEVADLRDDQESFQLELKAAEHGLNYVKLGGNIGTLVSGAGLALATLDMVKQCGGEPANFLDVPPVSQTGIVANAFKLLLSDPDVEVILVNVYGGGIMRCDIIADGLKEAIRDIPLKVPLVVRFAGTNKTWGETKLKDRKIPAVFVSDMAQAAESAVIAAAQSKQHEEQQDWWTSMRGLFSPDQKKEG